MRCHSVSLVLTKNGLLAKSILGLGFLKCKVGGISLFFKANTVFINPAIPADSIKCPIFVFTEPIAQKFFLSVFCPNA